MQVRLTSSSDGSPTGYSEQFNEYYHNRNGAWTQATGVFACAIQPRPGSSLRILEVGFGLGLNFLASLEQLARRNVNAVYRAFECHPVPRSTIGAFGQQHTRELPSIWTDLVSAWPENPENEVPQSVAIHQQGLTVEIQFADATQAALPSRWADVIYLDPFSPTVNPEPWQPRFLSRLADGLACGGQIATYSVAGHVRREFERLGLEVERRRGVAGKSQVLRARRVADTGNAYSLRPC